MDTLVVSLIAILIIVASVLYFAFEVTESQKNKVVFSDVTIPKTKHKARQVKKGKKAQTSNNSKLFEV